MTNNRLEPTVLEQARWFGPPEGRIFGWLTSPDAAVARGAVILAQPLGREARAARRAIRELGSELARKGFVTLRLDYPGTGDSSGTLDEIDVQHSWVNAIGEAAAYLGSFGLTDISAVGMRLGATILAAANASGLTLSSLVLWDPCESGRSFLREVGALESLRRSNFETPVDGFVVSSEWVFAPASVEQIRSLDLLKAAPSIGANRLLIITREDRAFPERIRRRLEDKPVEWEKTSEQGKMLDVIPLEAVLATTTIDRISTWLDEGSSRPEPFLLSTTEANSVVYGRRDRDKVKETFVRLGRRGLFGIVSEPLGESRGPLVVLLNTANEEHIGPSRLWVELSREWSSDGVRCVRFDLTGVGDSPDFSIAPERLWYEEEWLEDLVDVVRELQPQDSSNIILVGLCSGAYLAAEGALEFGARGACLLNPPVGNDLVHAAATFRKARFGWLRSIVKLLRVLHLKDRWLGTGCWQLMRTLLPRRYSEDLIAKVAKRGTALLVLSTVDDLSPYPHIPLMRSIDRRRVAAPRNYHVEFTPGLDHSMHVAKGRDLAVVALNAFVRDFFVEGTPEGSSEL